MLGCGTHVVEVWTRGGGERIPVTLPVKSINWEWAEDATTVAVIQLVAGPTCCESVKLLSEWEHELHILRQTDGDPEIVWLGPLIDIDDAAAVENPTVKLTARDLTAWWGVRWVHGDYDWTSETGVGPTSLVTQFTTLAADALAPDPSPNINLVNTTPGAGDVGERKVLAAEHRHADTILLELARDAVDFTAAPSPADPRRVLLGAPRITFNPDPKGVLTTEHFVNEVPVQRLGSRFATHWGISGAGGGSAGDAVFGESYSSVATLVRYGLIERRIDEPQVEDDASAATAARYRTTIAGESIPRRIAGGVLAPTSPFSLGDLRPGTRYIVSLLDSCTTTTGLYRLTRLQCAVDGAGEQISVVLVPDVSE